MLIIISPAKNLSKVSILKENNTEIEFPNESKNLIKLLKAFKPQQLSDLMKISPKLGELNYERFLKWSFPFKTDEKGTALHMFKGDVYRGMEAENFSDSDIEFAQNHLRILSGLYGVIKPLDLIMPYRLEMGTKLKNSNGKNLYEFWGDKITKKISNDIKEQGDNILINLASDEYFKSIKLKSLKAEVITPIFKEYKNGEYKIISIFAKKARGLMSRYIIKNKITKPDDLLGFDYEKYSFSEELSSENKLIFVR